MNQDETEIINDLYTYTFNKNDNIKENIKNLERYFENEKYQGNFYDNSENEEINNKIAQEYIGKDDNQKKIDYENFIDVYEEIKKNRLILFKVKDFTFLVKNLLQIKVKILVQHLKLGYIFVY